MLAANRRVIGPFHVSISFSSRCSPRYFSHGALVKFSSRLFASTRTHISARSSSGIAIALRPENNLSAREAEVSLRGASAHLFARFRSLHRFRARLAPGTIDFPWPDPRPMNRQYEPKRFRDLSRDPGHGNNARIGSEARRDTERATKRNAERKEKKNVYCIVASTVPSMVFPKTVLTTGPRIEPMGPPELDSTGTRVNV